MSGPGRSPTIAEVLAPALARQPSAPAVVARSGTLSYAGLDQAAAAAAGALWELGVRPGDRVAACLPNDLAIVAAFHGAQRIGAIWTGINESAAGQEQQVLADLARPSVVLAGARCAVRGYRVLDAAAWTRRTAAAAPAPAVALDPDAPAGIAFTSGTTGVPKGIVHSQRNMLLPGAVLVATRGWDASLRKGDCLPLTLLNMMVLSTLLVAQAGGCAVIMDRRDVAGVAEWISRERVTVWNGVPAQLHDLARRPEPGLAGLHEAWCGGAGTPDALREAFTAACGVPVRATYGLTEAPTVVAIDPPDGRTRPGASGLVLPHLDVAAYSADGRRLPAGSAGELCIGPAADGPWAGAWNPMLGEWRDGAVAAGAAVRAGSVEAGTVPAGTAPAGAIPTGDIGSVDAEGWLTVLDRKKLVIISGGANVYPAEVERVIGLHPAVAAAAVFGVPDDRLGETVAALVQLARPTGRGEAGALGDAEARSEPEALSEAAVLDEIEALCQQRLARYKVPRSWGLVGALPVNAMGKVIRTALPGLLADATGR